MQRQELLQVAYRLNAVAALRVHTVNVGRDILRASQRRQQPLRGAIDRSTQRRDARRAQLFNRRQPFRRYRNFHHQIVNDGAQTKRIFHHAFRLWRHDLRKQLATAAQRLFQRGQNLVNRRFAAGDNAWISRDPGEGKNARQAFDGRDVGGIEIEFHNQLLRRS